MELLITQFVPPGRRCGFRRNSSCAFSNTTALSSKRIFDDPSERFTFSGIADHDGLQTVPF